MRDDEKIEIVVNYSPSLYDLDSITTLLIMDRLSRLQLGTPLPSIY